MPPQSSFESPSPSASPTTPQSEGDPLNEVPLSARTIALIVLGIAILAFALVALFLLARSGSHSHRAFPAVNCQHGSSLSKALTRTKTRPAHSPALCGSPFSLPNMLERPRAIVLPYGTACTPGTVPGSVLPTADTHASVETFASSATWAAAVASRAELDAQPPSYTAEASDLAAAVPAHVCAVPCS